MNNLVILSCCFLTFKIENIAILCKRYSIDDDLQLLNESSSNHQSCLKSADCRWREDSDSFTNPLKFFKKYSCFCTADCHVYGDCCHDVSLLRQPIFQAAKSTTCRHLREVDDKVGVQMVSECSKNWDDSWITSQCTSNDTTDAFLNIPVRGLVTGLDYRNIYCAVCNHEKSKLWNVTVRCTDTQYLNISKFTKWNELKTCLVNFVPPNRTFRPCRNNINTCCPLFNDTEIINLCYKAHTSYLYYLSLAYKNEYCAKCNFKDIENLDCFPSEIEELGKNHIKFGIYPFAILMDMNTGTYTSKSGKGKMRTNTVNPKNTNVCKDGQIYDNFSGKCRRTWCPSNTLFVAGNCMLISTNGRKQTNIGSTFGPDVENNSRLGYNKTSTQCAWVKLNSTDSFFVKDTTLYVNRKAKYNASRYLVKNDSVFVCMDNHTGTIVKKYYINWKFSIVLSYINLIGISLSSVALTIQLLVYAILPSLRNTPGKNLMHLSASLLVANLLYITEHKFRSYLHGCVVIAIVMHMSFMLSFLWMNVMSFDVWYTFRTSFIKRKSSSKQHICYIIYAWTVALLIVGTAVILFVTGKSQFDPYYGLCAMCWICNSKSLVLFFHGPLAIIITTNGFFYVMTIRSIVMVDKATKITTRSNNIKDRCLLYAKLSSIIGLTWLFGLIAAFTDVRALWYLFTIFNTLQGLFICLSFVCNKNVLRKLREKVGYTKYELSTSSSQQTTSTSANVSKRSTTELGATGSDTGRQSTSSLEKLCDP